MSGGFFRGTSADQDTRFSNKQAKLMKSQKFAPELEHLVDTSKVKMDVVKPWIATRVTQLLGFEDEVLINFIYGLLDGKDVNGKEVQIQITGFMEKNTGKFMKELWGLLLSAQKNASGVPQQFLDEKEEEIRKKKVESDRITGEIQKKRELEQEKQKLMDTEIKILKHGDDKASTPQHEDDKGYSERNGFKGKNRNSRSPHPRKDSPSPNRINHSGSMSKSFSNSRSYSDDGHKSRSVSRSPQSRARSISLDRRYRSPRKRSISPYRKYSPRRPRSPLGRRSPISRRRFPFRSRRRSPSPRRRRSPSPRRRRSPLPRRRRSPSPMLRRSPSLRRHRSPITVRRRSPSPVRRSPSPVRRRSPSPVKRRSPSPVKDISPSPVEDRTPSPVRHRRSSPVRRRSPIAIRRSRTPTRYRSPYPPRRRSPSPVRRSPLRSPRRRRSPLRSRQRFRSGSPYRITSPPYRRRRSSSSDRDDRINGVVPRKYKEDYVSDRTLGRRSPQVSEREVGCKRLDDASRQPPISLRSPQREPRDRSEADRERPVRLPSLEVSPSQSGSSLQTGKSSPSEDRRASSRSESPAKNTKERTVLADTVTPVRQTSHSVDSRRTIKEDGTHYSRGQRNETPQRRIGDSPRVGGSRNIPGKDSHNEDYSPEKIAGLQLRERSKNDREIRMKDHDRKSEKASMSTDRPLVLETSTHMMEAVEYGPSGVEVKGFSPGNARDGHPSAKQRISPSPRTHKSYTVDDGVADEEKHPRIVLGEEADLKSTKRIYSISTNRTAMLDSDSENERNKPKNMERRKHKRRHIDSEEDSSDDSHVDERKEAKRRRKEEKRLRKEEKRRRREERHRKKEERRAGKLKAKAKDMVPPDAEKKYRKDDDDSDDQVAAKIDAHPSDIEEAEFEQKKLEIELREKALESLRAKKAINP